MYIKLKDADNKQSNFAAKLKNLDKAKRNNWKRIVFKQLTIII